MKHFERLSFFSGGKLLSSRCLKKEGCDPLNDTEEFATIVLDIFESI